MVKIALRRRTSSPSMTEIRSESNRAFQEVDVGRPVERHLETRAGLEIAFAIDDEGKASAADAQVFDQGVEGLEVDRGLDHKDLVTDRSLGGDDEVGRSTQTGEDVADEALAGHGILEPVAAE